MGIVQRQGPLHDLPRRNPTQPLFTDNRFHNIGVSAHKADFVPLARKALVLIGRGGGGLQQLDQLAIQTDMSGLGRFLVTSSRTISAASERWACATCW